MAPSTLAWKIPWMKEPGRLQSMGSLRVRHDWATSLSFFTFHFHALEKEVATHSSVLAWRIPGMGEPGGLPSMGSYRVGYDWRDLAAVVDPINRTHFKGLSKRSYVSLWFLDQKYYCTLFSIYWWLISKTKRREQWGRKGRRKEG